MLTPILQKSFIRDFNLALKRGKSRAKIERAIKLLCAQKPLPPAFRDHALKGKWTGFRDCHVEPDLVLVYRVVRDRLQLVCIHLGTHSDLFGR
jgi:mRNA interferase YafQ